jgi:hypothetical protein
MRVFEKSCPRFDRHDCSKEWVKTGIALGDAMGYNPDDSAIEQLVASKKQN